MSLIALNIKFKKKIKQVRLIGFIIFFFVYLEEEGKISIILKVEEVELNGMR